MRRIVLGCASICLVLLLGWFLLSVVPKEPEISKGKTRSGLLMSLGNDVRGFKNEGKFSKKEDAEDAYVLWVSLMRDPPLKTPKERRMGDARRNGDQSKIEDIQYKKSIKMKLEESLVQVSNGNPQPPSLTSDLAYDHDRLMTLKIILLENNLKSEALNDLSNRVIDSMWTRKKS